MIAATLLLPLGAIAALGARALGEAHRVHEIVDGDCPFFRDIGTAPLPPAAAALGRRIVLDARAAYDRRCIGQLGPLPAITNATPTPTPGR